LGLPTLVFVAWRTARRRAVSSWSTPSFDPNRRKEVVPAVLLLAAALGALLPFAPSLQGNYHRFVYSASFFFWGAVAALVQPYVARRPRAAGFVVASLFVCHIVGGIHREIRSVRRAEHVRRAVLELAEEVTRRAPNKPVVVVHRDVEHLLELCWALDLLEKTDTVVGRQATPATDLETPSSDVISVTYQPQHGYRVAPIALSRGENGRQVR
ncbi:MAG: hypothetical protein ACRDD1_14845, partial [Planctomycetia bacterium]